jgi:hypothetical protein
MIAIGFLALSIVVSILTISIVHDYFFIAFPPVVVGGSFLAALVGAGCVISFLVWFSRSYRNLRALGAEGLEYSPGVAIGWWFVPVVNCWKPFQVAVEIWRASDPAAAKNDFASRAGMPTPALLAIWWMGWLTALVLDNLVGCIRPNHVSGRDGHAAHVRRLRIRRPRGRAGDRRDPRDRRATEHEARIDYGEVRAGQPTPDHD